MSSLTHANNPSRTILPFAQLKRNTKPLRPSDLINILGVFAPPCLFALALASAYLLNPNFHWLNQPTQYPWQLWAMLLCGTVGTLGGLADWTFHRLYITVGPNEHRAHVLALLTGGITLFLLMSLASISHPPLKNHLLIPIVIAALYAAALVCYDEFIFHWRRCTRLENLFHRLLVFGNTAAWLAWLHWVYQP